MQRLGPKKVEGELIFRRRIREPQGSGWSRWRIFTRRFTALQHRRYRCGPHPVVIRLCHSLMLRHATGADFPTLRSMIRNGAATGSFDPALAGDSRESSLFFANLRRALTHGFVVEEDPGSGDFLARAVPGYVYVPDRLGANHRPIGFGLFKAGKLGFELWLAGVEEAWRGHGHGRAMIAALLNTTPGRQAFVVRLNTFGRASPAMAHLLTSMGYACVRETPEHTWFLRHDAPAVVGAPLRDTN